MAQRRSDHIQKALTSVLPRRRIRDIARRIGVVRRRRKLDIVALVYSLVLGFSTGDQRSLSGFRRNYFRATGTRLAPSSFYARFTPELTKLMRALATGAIRQLAECRPSLRGAFAPFVEVLAVDSALVRLHNVLEDSYPSVWTHYMKASVKLCAVMNVVGRGLKRVTLTHGSRHDVHTLKAGAWMKGRLLIFDLGYYQAVLFKRIDKHGGYFLCRMKANGNPIVVSSHKQAHRYMVGDKLRDALSRLDGGVVDVIGHMRYLIRHERRPLVTHHDVQWRCVAVYNDEDGQWHRYVTNMSPAIMKAEHISAVYAARWEVELLFRELKSSYRIDQMPSGNKHITETLIFAALLSLAVSRTILRSIIRRYKLDPERIPFDRWARLFAQLAQHLLEIALPRRIAPHRRLERFLRAEAIDPNRARIPLHLRAQDGVHQRA